MGTRNLTLVYYKGMWHIAQYCQLDGYPNGQGLTILRFIKNPENVSKLKAVLDAGKILYEPKDRQVKRWNKERQRAETEFRVKGWSGEKATLRIVQPSTSRDTGAEILDMVVNATERVPIVKRLEFIADPNCEWAYVVDLDKGALEVYGCCEPNNSVADEINRFAMDVSLQRHVKAEELDELIRFLRLRKQLGDECFQRLMQRLMEDERVQWLIDPEESDRPMDEVSLLDLMSDKSLKCFLTDAILDIIEEDDEMNQQLENAAQETHPFRHMVNKWTFDKLPNEWDFVCACERLEWCGDEEDED